LPAYRLTVVLASNRSLGIMYGMSVVRAYLSLTHSKRASIPASPVAALWSVTASVRPSIYSAVKGGDGWTAAQYAHTSLLLLNSTHNAVIQSEMEMQLGRHNSTAVALGVEAQTEAGGLALAAMVKANLLSLRPYCVWAQDILREAHGPLTSEPSTVITAASAVHLYCLSLWREKLQGTLDRWETQQKQVSNAEYIDAHAP
jgi:hypothetical protein